MEITEASFLAHRKHFINDSDYSIIAITVFTLIFKWSYGKTDSFGVQLTYV